MRLVPFESSSRYTSLGVKASAIILGAGSGVRLGYREPKAFVKLNGRTMLNYSLAAIGRVAAISEAVVTVPAGMEPRAREEVSRAGPEIPIKITAGGSERQDSVRIALELTSAESELVVVHDAARPLAQAALFERCLEQARLSGGAIAAIPVADSLKRVRNGVIIATVARSDLFQAQTPQAFHRAILAEAHRRAVLERWIVTDDAELVERLGRKIEIVEASALNLKITTAADLAVAEAIARTIAAHVT